MKKDDDEEICNECRLAVASGVALKVCKYLETKKECERLADLIFDEKITPKKLIKILKKKAKSKKDKKIIKKLETIELFMDGKDD